MAKRLLPTDEEIAALVPGPGSAAWRLAGDARTLLGAGYALVLQVSHPSVGAGVAEHSSYKEDPWGRLLRTLDFTNTLMYGEPAAAGAAARALRARHRTIRGVRADGARYRALDPPAYAWVWATLFESIVSVHRRFGIAAGREEEQRLWDEWRQLGRVLGVRERDLPAGLEAYEAYRELMVHDVLEANDSVRDVMASIASPAAPPLPSYIRPAWTIGRLPAARALRLATVGLLPAALRERLGVRLTPAEELELSVLGAASRSLTHLLPLGLRMFGPAYMRLRRPGAG
jgi:uncharacterized protein (DUF2236 family)